MQTAGYFSLDEDLPGFQSYVVKSSFRIYIHIAGKIIIRFGNNKEVPEFRKIPKRNENCCEAKKE